MSTSSPARACVRRPLPTSRRRVAAALAVGALLLGGAGATRAAASAASTTSAAPSSLGSGAVVVPHASGVDCARPAKAAGFTRSTAVTAVAVGLAESSCVPSARSTNPPTAGCPAGSVDRGLWQINSCYHSEVSNTCAYDAACNARAAYRISASGTDWTPWSTYNSGAYRSRLTAARAAVDEVWGTAWPAVRRGDTGERVRTVQHLLRQAGSSLAVDADFGPATENAVKAFQSAHGLTADGVVGPATWPVLVVTRRRGDSGEAVRAVQSQLVARGSGISVDGRYGAATETAVRGFQTSQGLSADGVVGPDTWRSLVS